MPCAYDGCFCTYFFMHRIRLHDVGTLATSTRVQTLHDGMSMLSMVDVNILVHTCSVVLVSRCMHAHMQACAGPCTFVCLDACMCRSLHVCVSRCMHVHTTVYTHALLCRHKFVCVPGHLHCTECGVIIQPRHWCQRGRSRARR